MTVINSAPKGASNGLNNVVNDLPKGSVAPSLLKRVWTNISNSDAGGVSRSYALRKQLQESHRNNGSLLAA